jgi:outer membrane lipoprotein-sorting protein
MRGEKILKNAFSFFVFTSLVLSFFSLFGAQKEFTSLQCDVALENNGVIFSKGKFYIKANKSRMESTTGGVRTIILINADKAYTYIPEQNMAMAMSLSEAKMQTPQVRDFKDIYKLVGEETVDGKLCDVYEYKDRRAGLTRIWIAKDIEFPVKSETGGVKIYYRNIRIDVSLDDALFELPAGVQIHDMGALMQQLR